MPAELPGENDDLLFGAHGALMAARIGAADVTVRNVIITSNYLSTIHIRFGWTLTIKDGNESVFDGGKFELGGKWTEGGEDNHSHGRLVLSNARVAWIGNTDIVSTVADDPNEANRAGEFIVGDGSILAITGPSKLIGAEVYIDGTSPTGE